MGRREFKVVDYGRDISGHGRYRITIGNNFPHIEDETVMTNDEQEVIKAALDWACSQDKVSLAMRTVDRAEEFMKAGE